MSILSRQTNCKLLWGKKFWSSDSGAPGTAVLNLGNTFPENPSVQMAPPHPLNRILGVSDQGILGLKSSPANSDV